MAFGIWTIIEKPVGSTDYIMAWLCICFFGLGIPVGLYQIFDRRPQIIINETGIWDRTTKQDLIKWEQIEDAYPLDIYKQKFVCLDLDDTFEIKKKLYKWAAKINENIGAQKVNLLLSQLKIDEHTMTKFIKTMSKTERENRTAVIRKYFDN
ncbi:hypothetical protein BEN48_14040 [Hymenobacter glacialis]|uniref:Uncharacterized protein n=1 Tax=Hymenobacter glacialis TaxID=1908236 RepID=A0A1G1T4L7_9BACT|nr:hypothetical protein BEN48_14040 [Hymenobacter glacialis]